MAVLGARSISLVMASLVFPLALASKNLPKVIRVKIIAADSKYRSMLYWLTKAMSPWPKP